MLKVVCKLRRRQVSLNNAMSNVMSRCYCRSTITLNDNNNNNNSSSSNSNDVKKNDSSSSSILNKRNLSNDSMLYGVDRRDGRNRGKGKLRTEFSVDTTGVFSNDTFRDIDDDNNDSNKETTITNPNKESLSELAKDLKTYIKLKGPISLHDYIAQALNHPLYGYYQHQNEKIGTHGDFITSPEITQLFGEMIAIWCISVWQSLGSPKAINIVELGPGKGTMMQDIIRIASQFNDFKSSINIHLVELSPTMRAKQREALGCNKIEVTPNNDNKVDTSITKDGIPVTWYSFLDQVPKDGDTPFLILGHEFLDAFPVHQFAYTKFGWREKLVDIDDSDDSKYHFRIVLSPNETPAIKTILGDKQHKKNDMKVDIKRDQKDILEDLKRDKSNDNNNDDNNSSILKSYTGYHPELKEGDEIEISPLSLATVEDIARIISKNNGAALIMDYGENFTQGDSIRAFKKHTQVHFLSEPGKVDITTDVDFKACSISAKKKKVQVFGATQQGEFLMRMGIVERLEQLFALDSTTDEQANQLMEAMKRLVTDEAMGKRFKVLGIANEGIPPLPGFPHD